MRAAQLNLSFPRFPAPRMRSIFILCLLLLHVPVAKAQVPDPNEPKETDYRPQSNSTHPCGVGPPPQGRVIREASSDNGKHPVVLTVRQDGNRLCYVNQGMAEAPVIRVRQGEQLAVTLRNEITDPAAIDRVIPVAALDTPNPAISDVAGFIPVVSGSRHQATGATNLHVHGFAVPPVAPQDEVMKTCTDPAVGPVLCGQRETTYRYDVPAAMPAGLYWYHPHIHGEVQAQMIMGLSGAIVVEGPEDDARRAAGIQDRIFIIRQNRDTDALRAAAASAANTPLHVAPPPAPPGGPGNLPNDGPAVDTAHEMGCSTSAVYDEITMNEAPVVDGAARDMDMAPLYLPQGGRQLWRVLNAATDAFLDLALVGDDGVPMPIEVVAVDGAPLTDDAGIRLPLQPTTESQLVPPAGRLEFMVNAPPVGKKAYLVSHAVDTGCAGDKVPERKLAMVKAAPFPDDDTVPYTNEAVPAVPPATNLFSGLIAAKTDRQRTIAFAEYPRPGNQDLNDFYVFERKKGVTIAPFSMGGPPTITADAGTVEEWVIENWTNELHAFHIHQLHFRVLEINGRKLTAPLLLDTVEVPFAAPADPASGRPAIPGTVRIKLAFPPELAGDILFHCHLVDHEDAGMMGLLRVVKPDGAPIRKAELPEGWPQGFPRSAICRPPSGTN